MPKPIMNRDISVCCDSYTIIQGPVVQNEGGTTQNYVIHHSKRMDVDAIINGPAPIGIELTYIQKTPSSEKVEGQKEK